jgi:uncharacterized SAM-binding protein YcdF (DUF218 family)
MTLFAFQKTLGLLAMPVGLLWLFLLASAGFCLLRKQRLAAALFLVAALSYALAGNVYLGSALMARLESGIPPVAAASAAPFDAVCVLGGGTEGDGLGGAEASQAGDRIVLAARLWHAGKARLLVTSGMSRDSLGSVRNLGEETRTLWRGLGVPDAAILVVAEPCWNTRDEILADRRLQLQHGWKRVGLLSSAWHLPRALALARKAGLTATPLGADWDGRPHPFQLQLLVPQAEGFRKVQRACWEFLGRRLGR